jgi:hypothetical protein
MLLLQKRGRNSYASSKEITDSKLFFCAGDTICVSIYESVASLDGVPKIVDDAIVLLYEDDNPADTLVYIENGLYVSDIIAQVGSVYKVEAFCKGHETCYACDTVPDLPVLTGVVFRDSALIDRDGYYISKAELTINSVELKTGYYQVKMFARYFDYAGIEEIGNMSFSQINNSDLFLLKQMHHFWNIHFFFFRQSVFTRNIYFACLLL